MMPDNRWCPKCGISVGVRRVDSAPGVPVWLICPNCGPVSHEKPCPHCGGNE